MNIDLKVSNSSKLCDCPAGKFNLLLWSLIPKPLLPCNITFLLKNVFYS